jgi:hypothetical protein
MTTEGGSRWKKLSSGEGKRNINKLKSYFSVSTNFRSIAEEKKLTTEEG